MRLAACLLFAMSLGLAQNLPENKPPTPAQPGGDHPMPIPKPTPDTLPPNAQQPEVRKPIVKKEKRRPKPVKPSRAKKAGDATDPSSSAPATSPKAKSEAQP